MGRVLALRIQALGDLLQRYGSIWRHAWRERDALTPPKRLPHEAQFLPAALALQETPVAPAPRMAMGLVVAFAGIALLWAIFGRIDVVATAQGRIVPSDRSKTIQPLEPATVKAIRVADGQAVRAGEVLIELDGTASAADKARISGDLVAARIQAARATALLGSVDSGRRPVLPRLPDVAVERQGQEQRLVEGQFAEYQARSARIDADLARREAELASTREIVRKLEQTAPMARQRAEDFKNLADRHFVSRHAYLDREQTRVEQEGDLAMHRSRLAELAAAIGEGRQQARALVAETRRMALDSLSEAGQRAAALAQELIKAEMRNRQAVLTAPVAGTVQQLAVHTVGGVVTEAQPLMVVVPRDDALEVEALVENKDVGFVNAGQDAVVKLETFPYTKYGTIPARVAQVSGDAISDEKRGLIYVARVRLERSTMQLEDRIVNLAPGMAATVEIKTGTRRVIEYFLSPLLQYREESLRER